MIQTCLCVRWQSDQLWSVRNWERVGKDIPCLGCESAQQYKICKTSPGFFHVNLKMCAVLHLAVVYVIIQNQQRVSLLTHPHAIPVHPVVLPSVEQTILKCILSFKRDSKCESSRKYIHTPGGVNKHLHMQNNIYERKWLFFEQNISK